MMSLASVSWEAASESDGTPDQNNGLFWPLTSGLGSGPHRAPPQGSDAGGTATGAIETGNDWDWFAVELVAGATYVIDLEGADSGGGTLDSTVLRGLYDSDGNRIAGTQTNRGGDGDDARLSFTATESGTYYIAARGYANATGTYTVRVTESVSDDGCVEFGNTYEAVLTAAARESDVARRCLAFFEGLF